MAYTNRPTRLVLGPENGAHIIIDPRSNSIEIYDNNGVRRMTIEAAGTNGAPSVQFYDVAGTDFSWIGTTAFGVPGDASLLFNTPTGAALRLLPSLIHLGYDGYGTQRVGRLNIMDSGESGVELQVGANTNIDTYRVRWTNDGWVHEVGAQGSGNIGWQEASDAGSYNVNNVAYNDAGASLGVVFRAPASGCVKVTLQAMLGTNATTAFTRNSFHTGQVRDGNVIGSGAIVYAASDNEAGEYLNVVTTAGIKRAYVMSDFHVSGLTPGDEYNVQSLIRNNVAGDSAHVSRRRIRVEPELLAQ